MLTASRTNEAPKSFDHWINGQNVPSKSGMVFERRDPFDGSIAGVFANGDALDAEAAIDAARAAFDSGRWSNSTARVRFQVLNRAARLMEAKAQDFAQRMVRESGKPLAIALGEIQGTIKTFEYYAGVALTLEGSSISERAPDALGLVVHEPVGVVVFITPWNFPLLNPAAKLAPALVAGCTVVAKPSHLCSGPTLLLAECLAEAGLPEGVFNVVTSDIDRGAVVGQALAGSPRVDKIAFTGSTAAGRAVMRAAASNNRQVSLELGGKSANIVFADGPVAAAAATAIGAFCFNSGQQCTAGTRLLVQRGIHEQFVETIVNEARKQVLGDPAEATTMMGPLVNEAQHRRVSDYIALGKTEGRLVLGGGAPPALSGSGSLFVAPTIFDDVDNSSRIAQEEIFGPVLVVIPFDDEADAIRLANDSAYGLSGAVWSNSINTAIRVAKAVRTGRMFVNCYGSAGIDDMPHGGYKDSGIGREFGQEGLHEFQLAKTVQIKLLA